MDSVKNVTIGVARGIRDSIFGMASIFQLFNAQQTERAKPRSNVSETVLAKRRATQNPPARTKSKDDSEPKIVNRLLQCCALNGGVFWVSIFVFHSIVLPSLRSLTHSAFGSSPGMAGTIWSWMRPILSYTFSALWVLPLFLLSKVVNSLWFQDIADSAYRYSRGRPRVLPSVSKIVADTFFSVLIQALFLVQGMLVSWFPIVAVGNLMGLLHMCLLYSLYAFEYKWFNMGWELHKRLSFIENNWPYFVGFGLPLAVLTALPTSYVVSGCVFSILFPLFIISGNGAEPFVETCQYPMKLFSPVVCLSNAIFNQTMRPKNTDTSAACSNVKTRQLHPSNR